MRSDLDKRGAEDPKPVTETSLAEARAAVIRIGDALRANDFAKQPRGDSDEQQRETCARCDLIVLCRDPV